VADDDVLNHELFIVASLMLVTFVATLQIVATKSLLFSVGIPLKVTSRRCYANKNRAMDLIKIFEPSSQRDNSTKVSSTGKINGPSKYCDTFPHIDTRIGNFP